MLYTKKNTFVLYVKTAPTNANEQLCPIQLHDHSTNRIIGGSKLNTILHIIMAKQAHMSFMCVCVCAESERVEINQFRLCVSS